ncbi:uncharacterized protein JNUCC1_00494 [Lentibacillus sp. JNUCC-1]|uniref:HAAS signaling domain-containing protein n=1 Tax=Lentibacillus sp. JNUCC-1 TaxID=2654513 RepID=UPI0012E8AFFA|nr:hypothetical protein [Lentibacillus sp. JNUCC-1]MUV36690.1 uncharacterized protein [Lentibacillus sp. JNUCC-1]
MTNGAETFLHELSREIGRHPEKQSLMQEYKAHVTDLLQEHETLESDEVYPYLVERLGTPKEIATVWHDESKLTENKMQWLFVLLNIALFVGGGLLTAGYNLFHWTWLGTVWNVITDLSFVVMTIYMLFWGLLGYEIGREFGHAGKKLLKKTFLLSILPNLGLMYLIIFKLIPHAWFGSMISMPFILLCTGLTAILYPVSWIGYRWGRRDSV